MEKTSPKKSLKKFKKIFILCLVLMFSFVLGGTLYAVNYSYSNQVVSVATT